ncbi:PEPxxWA-CTERM sorting domain-containing protein [Sphingomonas sp. SORGH_AS_0438]|uniref:PEPxxWA-CTERM sorting domain-containing protein n=1 Tax=Sphingomonas sp. SORGH_AS_0438 TaxID=3041756 RepID=UPI00285554D7|nr:PEPxxWA-CTERM sorting domain-containing protein [Sphingomonas sp. SORGH_AS_0438]MDR6128042.1 hypothetical protein [Sphingomonas sp. SORGH_AS_0438]
MRLFTRVALGAIATMTALFQISDAQAAAALTLRIEAQGSGYNRPDPTNNFFFTTPVYSAAFAVSLDPTDDPNLFVRIIQDTTYVVTFSQTGLTLSTSYFGSRLATQANAGTCYGGGPVAGQAVYNPSCGTLSANVSFGGPPISFFEGGITRVLVEDGDTLDGRQVEYLTNLVPEPATWALMLTGFALTGYALRRRRVAFA